MSRNRMHTLCAAAAAFALAVGCGASKDRDDQGEAPRNDADANGNGNAEPIPEQPTFVPVNVNVSERALALTANAEAFTMTLEGCASGYTQTFDASDAADARLYKYDRGCLAKLTTFTVGGIVYVPAVGAGFSTYAVGEIATFEAEGGGASALRVVVVHQLNPTIAESGETVEYRYAMVAAGDDTNIASSVVGTSATLVVSGQDVPDFDIRTVAYTGMSSTGGGQFVFGLECEDAMAVGPDGPTCRTIPLSMISYKLVEDTYGGMLSIDQADAIFTTPGAPIDPGTEAVPAGDMEMPRGGFRTKSATSPDVLTGPDSMHLHPQMMLVLKANSSYRYFRVDVVTLVQP